MIANDDEERETRRGREWNFEKKALPIFFVRKVARPSGPTFYPLAPTFMRESDRKSRASSSSSSSLPFNMCDHLWERTECLMTLLPSLVRRKAKVRDSLLSV